MSTAIRLEDLQCIIKYELVNFCLEVRLVELENLKVKFEKTKDLDDARIYQLTGIYRTYTNICEKWQAEIQERSIKKSVSIIIQRSSR